METEKFARIFIEKCPTLFNELIITTIDCKVHEKIADEIRNLAEYFELKENDEEFTLSDEHWIKIVFEKLKTDIDDGVQYDFLGRRIQK